MPRIKIGTRHDFSLEYLKSKIHYNPDSGIITNLKTCQTITRTNRDGYVVVAIKGYNYMAHRLAWFYMTGEWPKCSIDHKDRDRANNRWDNLRESTFLQNSANSGPRKGSSVKYKNVVKVSHKNGNESYAASMKYNGKNIPLGVYYTPEAAALAANKKAIEIHSDFAYTNQLPTNSEILQNEINAEVEYKVKRLKDHRDFLLKDLINDVESSCVEYILVG